MAQVPSRKRKSTDAPLQDNAVKKVGSGAEAKPRDTMLIHGISEDGENLAVLRAREDRIEAGVVRRMKEGEPIHGELVKLTPRPESPLVCDVEVELALPAATSADAADASSKRLSHGGPAQVATPSYRQNWDAIWSKKKPSTLN